MAALFVSLSRGQFGLSGDDLSTAPVLLPAEFGYDLHYIAVMLEGIAFFHLAQFSNDSVLMHKPLPQMSLVHCSIW